MRGEMARETWCVSGRFERSPDIQPREPKAPLLIHAGATSFQELVLVDIPVPAEDASGWRSSVLHREQRSVVMEDAPPSDRQVDRLCHQVGAFAALMVSVAACRFLLRGSSCGLW